ncbi:putative peroxisome biosynthesis protein [Talaromyces proteolyticus]|uniref:RING-type E3 ubiquitin transferase n=1 Tax=Talaromyces proteolyticus TaxID=1131652 RepID=A0AAD4KSA2_9EURO|nr:putative peroxisome biosynthesis protein [Talaromyces proteolyticus]KAH8698297.1 putative peroxisome biosynthesis protein [Talaromyces proteolyticus]
MSDNAFGSSEPPKQSPVASASAPTTHFFPFATSPDIIRSHEKDTFITASLTNQAQSIVRALKGARYVHGNADTIKNLTELLYFSLTTLIGNRTLGEEYCDVVQLEDNTLQLPSITRRGGYIVSSIILPWFLGYSLPSLRRKLRSKLERSIARQNAQEATQSFALGAENKSKSRRPFWNSLRVQQYILDNLDSLTSPSPMYALSLATFYFTGAYYHLSKRLWGLRYVFTKRIDESEQRVGYEVLGVLLVLQMTIQGIIHLRETIKSLQKGSETGSKTTPVERKGDIPLSSVQNPPSIPTLNATTARYDLSEDPTSVSWIPEGQNRKCTLCLELFKDPSVTTCGHVFCWTCIRDWVREKPECPLCRQEVLASKILPVRG